MVLRTAGEVTGFEPDTHTIHTETSGPAVLLPIGLTVSPVQPSPGGPAVALALTSNPSTVTLARTVTIAPSRPQPCSFAPFAFATDAAASQGTPGRMPTATSAAASAAASAAPDTRCFAASTIESGRRSETSGELPTLRSELAQS